VNEKTQFNESQLLARAPELIGRLRLSRDCENCSYRYTDTIACFSCELDYATADLIELLLKKINAYQAAIQVRNGDRQREPE